MFDLGEHLDDLRCRPTGWLRARRVELVREQRRLRVEELAVTRVLDERDAIDPADAGRDGVSERRARELRELARKLEQLPHLAKSAHQGRLSDEQLDAAAKLADADSDAEWAERAPNVSPEDLWRLARNRRKPSTGESRARFAARSLRMWWNQDRSMLQLHGQLPDVMGATFEATITKLTELMKPRKGAAWDSFEHRAADALLQLCDSPVSEDEHAPSPAPRPVVQVHVPLAGPAEVAGVPIADSLLEQLRANASIELVLLDHDGTIITVGKRTPGLSPKLARTVRLRDRHCRFPSCNRTHGLEVHHLVPRSRGGTDTIANLAAVCATHHRMLVPHGDLALTGNPNQPDGLHLQRVTDARAGPVAA